MDIKEIVINLYTNCKSDWIENLDDSMIKSFLIQRWLNHNDQLRNVVRYCDKYVFYLPEKMYLSLIWSLIKKKDKLGRTFTDAKTIPADDPFLQTKHELDFILNKVKRYYEISHNDFVKVKPQLIKAIRADMKNWFMFFAIEKTYYKRYNIEYEPEKEKKKRKNWEDY